MFLQKVGKWKGMGRAGSFSYPSFSTDRTRPGVLIPHTPVLRGLFYPHIPFLPHVYDTPHHLLSFSTPVTTVISFTLSVNPIDISIDISK